MGFLDANGVTRLVTDLGNIFEYKLTAGGGIAINASNVLSTDVQLADNATSAVIYTASGYKWGVRVDDSVNDVSYYLRGTPSNLTFATRTPAAPASGTMTNDWTLTLPLNVVELGQVSGPARSLSIWRGWNDDTFGDYVGLGGQNDDATDGFRTYIGEKALRFSPVVGSTFGTTAWYMFPSRIPQFNNNTSKTVSSVTSSYYYATSATGTAAGTAHWKYYVDGNNVFGWTRVKLGSSSSSKNKVCFLQYPTAITNLGTIATSTADGARWQLTPQTSTSSVVARYWCPTYTATSVTFNATVDTANTTAYDFNVQFYMYYTNNS